MIGVRTRYSLAQFLELQEPAVCVVILGKYGVQHLSLSREQLLYDLLNTLRGLDDRTLMLALSEVVATTGDLRARVNPKYRFDERMHDLAQCLLLDGYIIQEKKLVQTDPSIADAAPLEDDLVTALQNSGAPRAQDIIAKINDSAEAFRATPPDYNASLVNARVALETLAVDVATHVASLQQSPTTYNPSKWGEVLSFLRSSGEITVEEEKGLAGVFGFLSPGAHRPVGIPEDQMTRLGRSFALNMCWFLLKNHLARSHQP
ncbi:TPA: hypothetical protein P7236_003298 [Pseudomonas aeruginosa]|jgi:hypothetical protein|uniref:Uncharacterized protein n=1 Tax=Pseudomonas aeruginosa TaxID=287 RepID=A0A241XGW9_PSEAI|nr:hypothetical protein [Pseudomonas aeruginosa]ALZ24372.2 hypothetical protein HV96_06395 [Pseudomonas aeruginosa]AMA38891.1 hypothetical protein DPADHS01_23375 [Pseudomonas aeruginosa DHS01]AWE86080.1 hypothetical protein CSC29_4151 [Pseudomonas aeruginosa]EJZ8926743.1 hypothetical protein [Pseudomonas aeruginosa]ESZ84172.1 hypothetical protein V441_06070 [Pseudomonas aeruginosa DHS29]